MCGKINILVSKLKLTESHLASVILHASALARRVRLRQ